MLFIHHVEQVHVVGLGHGGCQLGLGEQNQDGRVPGGEVLGICIMGSRSGSGPKVVGGSIYGYSPIASWVMITKVP